MRSTLIPQAIAVFSLLSHSGFVVAQGDTCYYPDGSESGDVPCQTGDGIQSFCCPNGSTCEKAPGPLCKTSNGDFMRGSCNVQDWTSTSCPKFCLAINVDNPVERCSSSSSQGRYCCGYDADKELCDCPTSNNTFVLNSWNPIQVLDGVTNTRPTLPPTATPTPTPSASPSSSPPSSSAQTTASNDNASSTPSAPSTILNSPSASSSTSKVGLGVGLGIGIPLALALLGVLAWFLIRRRRRAASPPSQPELPATSNAPAYPPQQNAPPNGGYGYYGTPKPEWAQNQAVYAHHAASTPVMEMPADQSLKYGMQGPPAAVHEMEGVGRKPQG